MIGLLVGVSAYLVAGTLGLVYRRWRFGLSSLGWIGALSGLIFSSIQFNNSGPLIGHLGAWGVLGIEVKVDPTTILFATLVVVINLFTLLYLGQSKSEKFFCLYNLLLATSFSMAFSNDLFNIYVTIELMSLIAILLIGFDRKTYQIYAGIKYLILSSASMSLYLIGLAIVYRGVGHLSISKLGELIGSDPRFSISLGLGLMTAGLAVKAGVLLFSMWLPDAHSYSGTVVSALLSGMAIKCGLVGIIRISSISDLGTSLLVLGALSGVGGGIFALFEKMPKKILAYSTISQIGYVLIAVGIGNSIELMAGSLHLLFHGLYKSLMFLVVGHEGIGRVDIGSDGSDRSLSLAGKVGLFVGSLSIAAVPPFEGFFSKSLILDYADSAWVWNIILVIGVITALIYIRLIGYVLGTETTWTFNRGEVSLLSYSLTVAAGGLISLFFARGGWKPGLFCPAHLIDSLGVLGIALVLYLLFKRQFRRIQLPETVFNLDNSLISLFTGLWVIVLLLTL